MTASEPRRGMVAVDLGGTNLRLALFDEDGKQRYRTARSTPPAGPASLADTVADGLARAATEGLEIRDAVVGVPGWVDHRANAAVTLPNLPAWGRLEAAPIERELGIRVTMGNDADLAALGEHRFGAGTGVSDLVYVTCSTGVGAGVIVGGRLLRPHRSIAEIGHTVIDWATGETVEALSSGTALARAAGMAAHLVAARAHDGDEVARRHFHRAADALGVGVLNMALLFGPERVVIGGGMSEAGALLLDPVRERIDSCRSPLLSLRPEDIVLAGRGQDAGLLGAFAFWLDSREPDSRS